MVQFTRTAERFVRWCVAGRAKIKKNRRTYHRDTEITENEFI